MCAGYAALPHTPPQRGAHMGTPLRNAAIPRDTPRLLFLGRGYRPQADTPARVPPAIPLEYAGGFGMMIASRLQSSQ